MFASSQTGRVLQQDCNRKISSMLQEEARKNKGGPVEESIIKSQRTDALM